MAAGGGEEQQGGPAAEDYAGKGQVSVVESNVSFSRSGSRSGSRSKLGGQGRVSGCKESRNPQLSGIAIAIAKKCIRPGPCSIDRRVDCQQETIDKGQGACHGGSRSTESASVRLVGPTPPSLGAILQSKHQKAAGAPSSASNTSHVATAATAGENNKLPTAITVTITLATVAGLATLAVALLFIYSRRRRRRSGPLGPLGPLALGASADTPSRLHRQDDAKRNSSSNSPSASALSPLYPPPPPRPLAASSSSSSISSSLGNGNGNGSNATPDGATLTPPPRLPERKYHSSIKSDSSIQLVKKHTHTK